MNPQKGERVDHIKHNTYDKWTAYIRKDGKRIYLGVFSNFDDAVKARKQAEEKYFKEWSYDNSMNVKID